MDKQIIMDLGLTANETHVYLTLLKTGSVSVNTIAEKSGLHRQAVYDALERLLEKGFVSYVLKQGKKHFQGISPENVLEYLKVKEEKYKSILPELMNLTKLPREDCFVDVYKGKDVVRTVFRDIMNGFQKKAGEVLITGVVEKEFFDVDTIALQQYLNRLRKLGGKERVLIQEGDMHTVEGTQTRYRWMPKEAFSPTPVYVYANTVVFLLFGNPSHAIMVKNKALADSYRRQFNLIWSISRELPKRLRKID
ncbi:hypothetical protein J4464_05020 [Candidatus Woesearchaeota archaeon]|nr:hypothetical protein [Candidatus Woesearchaeota archaeon]